MLMLVSYVFNRFLHRFISKRLYIMYNLFGLYTFKYEMASHYWIYK